MSQKVFSNCQYLQSSFGSRMERKTRFELATASQNCSFGLFCLSPKASPYKHFASLPKTFTLLEGFGVPIFTARVALKFWHKKSGLLAHSYWSGRRDSNSRPSPWQGDALPLSHSRIVPYLMIYSTSIATIFIKIKCFFKKILKSF